MLFKVWLYKDSIEIHQRYFRLEIFQSWPLSVGYITTPSNRISGVLKRVLANTTLNPKP